MHGCSPPTLLEDTWVPPKGWEMDGCSPPTLRHPSPREWEADGWVQPPIAPTLLPDTRDPRKGGRWMGAAPPLLPDTWVPPKGREMDGCSPLTPL